MKTTSCMAVLWVVLGMPGSVLVGAQPPPAGNEVRILFRSLDKNRDGKVTLQEYSVIWKKSDKAERSFQHFDRNSDGVLTEEELTLMPDELERQLDAASPQPETPASPKTGKGRGGR